MKKMFKLGAQLALITIGAASALPALPGTAAIASAVQQALTAPAAAPSVTLAALNDTYAAGSATGRTVVARATAYNSLGGQTDSTPNITATGTRTRPGVVALSRDLLRVFPYGTRVQLQDLSGRHNFGNQVFVVEDTMNIRKTNSIDIWLPSYSQAIGFGAHTVRITALR